MAFLCFVIIEVLLCITCRAMFRYLDKLPSASERRQNAPYAIVIILLIIALGILYSKWNPSRLLIIDECEKENPSYHKYFIISDYQTKEGLTIRSEDGYSYIYNCSDNNLMFREYTYGYKGSYYLIIRPKTFMSVPALPDYLFTNNPPQPSIRTTKYNNRLTRYYLDFVRD